MLLCPTCAAQLRMVLTRDRRGDLWRRYLCDECGWWSERERVEVDQGDNYDGFQK